ncbi:hypothetical protein V6N13_068954 [Hibiscus sabdariffa]|uniref:Bifunctional inhibitor/plant lipid transfer protein/seed storage helical domain-containing protein n=1 Tax=Hibiscus sabdariffa TaxID=183260 RepID=A0ABR2QP38_9ROSI
MCASIKFLAILIFLTACGFTRASANREAIGLVAPHRTLINESPPYEGPFSRYFDVISLFSPCLTFFNGRDSDPLPECCANVKEIAELRENKKDELVYLCQCMAGMWRNYGPYDSKRLPLVGKACHIDFYIPPIDGNTNCSRIAWDK